MIGHVIFHLSAATKKASGLLLLTLILVFSDQVLATSVELPAPLKIQQSTATQSTKLLILGDSLSAGYGLLQAQSWVSLLQNIWTQEQRTVKVINAAISGETTDGGLARLPRLLEQHHPTHVLIELGGNDGLQGHNVQKIQANLEAMITIVKSHGATAYLQAMQIPTNYGKRYNQLFNRSFDTVAAEHAIPLIPFFLQDIALNDELMQRDGIHPNAEGQPIIAEFMHRQLTPLIFAQGE